MPKLQLEKLQIKGNQQGYYISSDKHYHIFSARTTPIYNYYGDLTINQDFLDMLNRSYLLEFGKLPVTDYVTGKFQFNFDTTDNEMNIENIITQYFNYIDINKPVAGQFIYVVFYE